MSDLPITPCPRLSAVVGLLAAAGLPTEDLTEAHCENFFYAGAADAPGGLVGLELFDDVALLRSLVVADDHRGSGMGSRLLECAEGHARAHGVKDLFLLTTTAEDFFAHRGYIRVPRETAPPRIRATREFSGICPASSAFMVKKLA